MISRRTMIISQWLRITALIIFLIFVGIKQWWLPFGVGVIFLIVSFYMLIQAYRRSS